MEQQFLCLKYFLAKVHTQQNNLYERKRYLELSRGFFKEYLHQCAALRILDDEDVYREDNDDEVNLQNRTQETSYLR